MSDIVAMMMGFGFAARGPAWVTIAIALAMEIGLDWMIRDNLTLNVIMLVWPLDGIKAWQAGA